MSPRHVLLAVVSSICAILVTGLQRENLAVRHPCYAINKRLDKHITWTEKLASSQYKGKITESTFADEGERDRINGVWDCIIERSARSSPVRASCLIVYASVPNVPVSHSS